MEGTMHLSRERASLSGTKKGMRQKYACCVGVARNKCGWSWGRVTKNGTGARKEMRQGPYRPCQRVWILFWWF